MVHAHLEHGVAGTRGQTRERERHAPMIVVGGDRGVGLSAGRARKAQRLLRACLADRAGDADYLGVRTRTGGACEGAQAVEDLGHGEQRRVLDAAEVQPAATVGGDDRQPGAALECGRHELMAVAVVPGDGEERFAQQDAAAVDRNAADRGRQRAGALGAHRLRHGVDGPERLAHAGFPSSAAATASWSLNGSVCLPMIWPVSWPLPATSSTSPRRSSAIAEAIASRRSPISIAPGAALRIAARMAAGSSLRGLSSVTITRSALATAISPIIGRLPASRSPPQPKTTTRRPVA